MILTCNSAIASLMLSRFLYFEDMNDIDKSQSSAISSCPQNKQNIFYLQNIKLLHLQNIN
jgi:hypothetical protein